jgi:hypothetical protein
MPKSSGLFGIAIPVSSEWSSVVQADSDYLQRTRHRRLQRDLLKGNHQRLDLAVVPKFLELFFEILHAAFELKQVFDAVDSSELEKTVPDRAADVETTHSPVTAKMRFIVAGNSEVHKFQADLQFLSVGPTVGIDAVYRLRAQGASAACLLPSGSPTRVCGSANSKRFAGGQS